MPETDEEPDDPRLPWQPVGASLSTAASMMRSMPVFGPGIAAAQDELGRVENLLWREVRQRIEDGDANGAQREKAGQLLAGLLTQAVEQSAAQARERLIVRLLEAIEPDEARILAAMSDGTTYPLIHVITKTSLGMAGARLLENVSTVGRSAGIALPDYVPIYVARLRRLGLVTVGPESDEHADGYELLATEALVREARESHGAPTRLLRRTLTLSSLGRDLWDLGNGTALAE
ncbi:MAG: Abi-alpha family protein [Nocardioidaceae bacterium]